ncbi:MAG: M16 family metallopeptidase [Planctomycetota bacterium]|jgi:predicted Zn-dependent peptidase
MHTRRTIIGSVIAGITITVLGPTAAADIPLHPDEIEFPPLVFEPPPAADYRHTLDNGVPVYLVPGHEFPLVNVAFTFKGAGDLDPPDKVGLASAAAAMMRRGGTTNVSAENMDEELDFLAAIATTGGGRMRTTATLNSLRSNFDESFALFMDMVRNPGYQANRLSLYKQERLEEMKQRNDHPAQILTREWRFLLYGENHFEAALPTESSIESLTESDLRSMHRRVVHPGNLIVAVSGDFEPKGMLERLEKAFEGWAAAAPVSDPPAPKARLSPGVYHVEKDIPQGRISIGMRGIRRDDPDYFPMLLMNRILGGGGFTSRIVTRVRSDEGLAYSARSAMSPGVYYPGEFRASFQSKSRTVALGTKIILEEIERIRNEPVSDDELQTAKNALIERLPRAFESKTRMLNVFVDDELTRRPADYWQRYRDNVRAVTPKDIMRVAQTHLRPQEMAILLVGKWADVAPGDLEGRAQMSEFFGGEVTHLPLRDPLTLKPTSVPAGE